MTLFKSFVNIGERENGISKCYKYPYKVLALLCFSDNNNNNFQFSEKQIFTKNIKLAPEKFEILKF